MFLCFFLCDSCPAAPPCGQLRKTTQVWWFQAQECGGCRWSQVCSLQQAAALDGLVFACGVEQLDGLFVDQSPEVLEGDVLTALNAHLLQNLTQTVFVLHTLQTGNRK